MHIHLFSDFLFSWIVIEEHRNGCPVAPLSHACSLVLMLRRCHAIASLLSCFTDVSHLQPCCHVAPLSHACSLVVMLHRCHTLASLLSCCTIVTRLQPCCHVASMSNTLSALLSLCTFVFTTCSLVVLLQRCAALLSPEQNVVMLPTVARIRWQSAQTMDAGSDRNCENFH